MLFATGLEWTPLFVHGLWTRSVASAKYEKSTPCVCGKSYALGMRRPTDDIGILLVSRRIGSCDSEK